jgi:site-specific DNA-cytosine methylase
MKILIACEESQTVCEEFRKQGHEAYSNDMVECTGGKPEWHLRMCAKEAITSRKWDMIIAHPPCTYLSVSGLHWNKRTPGRQDKTDAALDFVRFIMDADCDRIVIENPVSCISSKIRKPNQIIHPHQFGDDASKRTCLWIKGLPLLKPTEQVEPRIVGGKERWANQMDNGQNVTLNEQGKVCGWNTAEIKRMRSKTYIGIAKAMAAQWGGEGEFHLV